MDLIWNKEEYYKIKIALRKFNLIIDNNEIVPTFYKRSENYFIDDFTKEKLLELFHYKDKEEIYKLLKLTIPIRYIVKNNKDNPLCNGLLVNLSNINPKDAGEIFTIYTEIIFQYSRIISKVTDKIFVSLKDNKLIKEEINKIKNSNIETTYEVMVKNTINKLLNCTYGIDKFCIFKDLIEYNNSKIKNSIVDTLEKRIDVLEKREENKNNKIVKDYGFDITGRLIKERQRKAKYIKK